MMRVSHPVLMALAATLLLSGPAVSQRPDNQLSPLSITFFQQGQQQLSLGKFDEASDSLESALAVSLIGAALMMIFSLTGAVAYLTTPKATVA